MLNRKSALHIAQVALSTVGSRVLGLLRDALAVRVLGAGGINSAFLTAFTLPNLFRRLLGEGALTGAMMPLLAEENRTGGRNAAFASMNRIFSWLVAVSGAIVVLFGIGILTALSWSGAGDRWRTLGELCLWLLPYLVFVCGAAAQAAALNLFGRFLAPALSQIWLNLSMIFSLNVLGVLLADTDLGRARWLCAGVLVGGVLQLAVPARDLWKIGWRPRWDLRWESTMQNLGRMMLPSLAGAAVYQINLAVSRFLAFDLNESATTLLFLGSRLMELPIGVFSVAVSSVLFPMMARQAADKDSAGFVHSLRQGTLLTLLINVPAAVGLAVLSAPIVRLLFERGKFTTADSAALVPVVWIFAAALPLTSLINLTVRGFHSHQDMRTPLRASVLSFAVNVAGCLLLPIWMGTAGLALASSLSVVGQSLYLQAALARRHPAAGWRSMLDETWRIVLASLAMGLAVHGLWRKLPTAWLANPWHEATLLLAAMAAGGILYFLLALLLRVKSLTAMKEALLRKKIV